jgi:hypothetical protein
MRRSASSRLTAGSASLRLSDSGSGKTPLETRSDGYATGLVTLALLEAGLPPTDSRLNRSLVWLSSNQQKTDGRLACLVA